MKPNEVSRTQVSTEQLEVIIYLKPEHFWFKGHFDAQAILPGVAQIDWVINYAKNTLLPSYRFQSIHSVKFNRPLLPQDTITLTLQWNLQKQVLSFAYHQHRDAEKLVASSGKIRLCQ